MTERHICLGSVGYLTYDTDNLHGATGKRPSGFWSDDLFDMYDSDHVNFVPTVKDVNNRIGMTAVSSLASPTELRSLTKIDIGDLLVAVESSSPTDFTVYAWLDDTAGSLVDNPPYIVRVPAAPGTLIGWWLAVAGKYVYGTPGGLDHGSLGGLSDDDHSQYFLLAGETTDAKLYSGADFYVYSDSGSTMKFRVLGASGNTDVVGTLEVTGDIYGDTDCEILGSIRAGTNMHVDGELRGSKHSLGWSWDASNAFGSYGTLFLKCGEVTGPTGKCGWVAPRAGSLVGATLRYDVTAYTGTPNLRLRILVNGILAWDNAIVGDGAVANDVAEYFTQARDTDTFSAGDIIAVLLFNDTASGTVTVDDMCALVEVYYDA